MEKISKIFSVAAKILEWAVFVVLILIFLVVLSPLLPTKKYLSTFIVASGSMEPTIKTGSVALVQPVNGRQVKQGDIVIFTSPTNPNEKVLHRVNQVVSDSPNLYFITKGDNNNAPDNWKVPAITVQDKFITSIPYLGFPAAFLKKPLGFAILVGIPALVLIILEVKQIMQGIEEEIQKRTDKMLKKKESKKTSGTNPVTAILIGIIVNSLIIYGCISSVKALFSARATVNGISFSVDAPDPSPTPTVTPTPTDTPEVTASPTASSTDLSSPTPTPDALSTQSPEPTATPSLTPSPDDNNP